MNLQQLRYLVAAADSGSLSAAAREQGVSQPVVSRSLHALERELGVELFRRDGRRLIVTDAGKEVVASAREALDAVDDVHRVARRVPEDSTLAIATTPTSSSALLGPIVTSYIAHEPQIAMRLLRAGDMEEVSDLVAAGDADLGFGSVRSVAQRTTLALEPLWETECVLVSPAGTDLPPVFPLRRSGEIPLVLPPDGAWSRHLMDEIFRRAGAGRIVPVLETDERAVWTASAQQGVASFLTYRALAVELTGVDVRPVDPPYTRVVGFLHGATISPHAQRFIDRARDTRPPAGCTRVVSDTLTP